MLMDEDMGEVSEEQEEFLKRGYETNERMIKLVSDLLNVSRIEDGRFGYEFVKFPIEKVAQDLFDDYKPIAKQKKINLILKTPDIPLPLAAACAG